MCYYSIVYMGLYCRNPSPRVPLFHFGRIPTVYQGFHLGALSIDVTVWLSETAG